MSSAYVDVSGGPLTVLGNTIETDGVFLDNPPTTTNAANVRLGAAGQQLALVTSLSEHKLDQQPPSAEAVRGVLNLSPKTWFDRAEVEANHGSTEGLRRIPGLVAEDVAEHAPDLALYDADGGLQGVAYDRLAALLIPIIREQQERIEELEGRLGVITPT